VKCSVFKIVEDGALADPIVLVWIFNDWFLEIGAEVKDLRKVKNTVLKFEKPSGLLLWHAQLKRCL